MIYNYIFLQFNWSLKTHCWSRSAPELALWAVGTNRAEIFPGQDVDTPPALPLLIIQCHPPPFPPPSGCPSCNPNLREFHHAPLQSPHIRRDYGMLRIRFQIVFPLDKLQNNRCRNCLHWQPLQLQPQSCLQWSFSSGYFQKIFWNFGSFCQILIL